jgi:hypothetical protein
VHFYQTLFGQEPTKTKPGYAKFEVADPPVNLSLNEVTGGTGRNNPAAHFGIQVKSRAAVSNASERLAAAGITTDLEEDVTCCYAVQNKVWATDPDGNKWEVYVVTDNDGTQLHSSARTCCPDDCCAEHFETGNADRNLGREAAGHESGCGCRS